MSKKSKSKTATRKLSKSSQAKLADMKAIQGIHVANNNSGLKILSDLFAAIKPDDITDKIKSHLVSIHTILCKIQRRRAHYFAAKRAVRASRG